MFSLVVFTGPVDLMRKVHKLMSKHLEQLCIHQHFLYVQLMPDMTKKVNKSDKNLVGSKGNN